jgi:hypothetical protein
VPQEGRCQRSIAASTPRACSGHSSLDASFVSAARLDSWLDHPPSARHRFVLGAQRARPGYHDFLTAARHFSDSLPSYAPLGPADAATADGTTYREWGALAAEVAAQLGLRAGDRLLVDSASFEHPVHWLLAPLAVGASVIVWAHLDRSRLEADRITHTSV